MSPDRLLARRRRADAFRSTYGELAFACLLISAVAGVVLAVPYDVARPYDSVASLLLANPGAAFFRSMHYWAAQLFLVLTLLHVWDHLRRGTEVRVPAGVWARVTLSLPLAGFLMLSGFMLKGDAEGTQALRIVTALMTDFPVVGRILAAALFGVGADRQILYVHHVATASILVWLFVAEHGRFIWPRAMTALIALVCSVLLSLVWSPSLHDGLDGVVKGPWYFLGVQEALHWLSRPLLLVPVGVALLVLVFLLPRLSLRTSRNIKRGLAALAVVYASLTAVAFFFRGENWTLVPPARAGGSGLVRTPLSALSGVPVEKLGGREIPVVLGRREGCLICHGTVTGLSAAHSPQAVGCASCHAGNPFALDRRMAHAGLILVPGNLRVADRTCGTPQCHPAIVDRVRRSIMTTMAGVIGVDRAVWGEGAKSPAPPDIGSLGNSPADTHLRQLCASCHLGTVKKGPGRVDEESRGGGCTACHLTYGRPALDELRRYEAIAQVRGDRVPPSAHPDVSLAVTDDHCFGCHSRSGRISLGYEGWHETQLARPDAASGRRYRTLQDGRVLVYVGADVHQARGMACIDCHTSREAMGDGVLHRRHWEQESVGCEDCHPTGRTTATVTLDPESARILALRNRAAADTRFLVTADGGQPLVNTVVKNAQAPWLWSKVSGDRLELRRPAADCLASAHRRLSCITCHAAWSPRCVGCHTRFDGAAEAFDHVEGRDVRGGWIEEGREFVAEPPTLGGRSRAVGGAPAPESVDPFIPGMVLTIDRNRTGKPAPDLVFRRLYARTFSHTVSKAGRSCESCHNDPVALGYGSGRLTYDRVGGAGRWRFEPDHPRSGQDGLPADAWIGFLQTRSSGVSTRADVSPFTVDEQKRILTVGACLTCHPPGSRPMREALGDFAAVRARVSPRCLPPSWD